MQVLLGKHWQHLPIEQAVELLETNLERGLDLFEIKSRQERSGPNLPTRKQGKSPWARFLLQLNNPLVHILLAASVLTALVKDEVDAVSIFSVVLVNAVVGFVQEARAEAAIEALFKPQSPDHTRNR